MSENELNYNDSVLYPSAAVEPSHVLKETNKRIHPIIVYPFSHPQNTDHLKALYGKLAELCGNPHGNYYPPITVLNRQTIDRVCTPKMNRNEAREAKERFDSFLATEVDLILKLLKPGVLTLVRCG